MVGRPLGLVSGKLDSNNDVVEMSPGVVPSLSVEKVPDVDCGMKTDETGLPVWSVGGKELAVGREGGRWLFPL